ncbi:hypothetical protein FDUTEX481_07665 [Tolypothrix sp. PCC 7601]|nr:hypothetical protein FDUTEX481_07665 [Tolypothrix sp. PCC 7601]
MAGENEFVIDNTLRSASLRHLICEDAGSCGIWERLQALHKTANSLRPNFPILDHLLVDANHL